MGIVEYPHLIILQDVVKSIKRQRNDHKTRKQQVMGIERINGLDKNCIQNTDNTTNNADIPANVLLAKRIDTVIEIQADNK